MRWKVKSDPSRFGRYALYVLLSPVIVIIFAAAALTWATEKLQNLCIKTFGVSTTAHLWYAWYPVKMSFWTDHNDTWVWREKIWRIRTAANTYGEVVYALTKEELEHAIS